MYRVDRNNFYQENKNASIQTPDWVSNFLFELLSPYIKKEGIIFDPCVGKDYYIIYNQKISFQTMMDFVKNKKKRYDFDNRFLKRTIIPDGGLLILKKKGEKSYSKIILVSETKRQGTNDLRVAEGKKEQAQGNAIERLGKNLIGIKTMFNHEKITPFVCFGWGWDFRDPEGFVMSKVSMLNEFYPLNTIFVKKTDGSPEKELNSFSPVSMFFREKEWTKEEMFKIMKEVAETALNYWLVYNGQH